MDEEKLNNLAEELVEIYKELGLNKTKNDAIGEILSHKEEDIDKVFNCFHQHGHGRCEK